jgi:FkbM family methyltransferase
MVFKVTEKENIIFQRAKEANRLNQNIYIYGCGEIGKIWGNIFAEKNIPIKAYLVDGAYYVSDKFVRDVPVQNMDLYIPEKEDVVLVAIRDYSHNKINDLSLQCNVVNEDIFSVHFVDEITMDVFKFCNDNSAELSEIYESLNDEKSKEHMTAFFNQKISGKMKYLKGTWEDNQYYDKDIVDFSRIHSFVDCGAYDGDSYKSFIENYKLNMTQEYDGKSYLLEPDVNNYEKLLLNLKEADNVKCLNLGAWDKKETLHFNIDGTSSGISESGDISIDVDSIDNLVGENRVDFIKMDIEGSALNALHGAQNTIRKYKPILAICVYHKKNDLLTIPKYIHSLCPEYKFYLRAHSKYSQELVLYAVL